MTQLVPAWQVQSGSFSGTGFVYILTSKITEIGWPQTRLVDALLPVDPEEQARLKEVRPEWLKP